jgi:membrane protein DedA with SNARE-associated domain/membrane-associated phospholipid phosphatase
MNGSILQPFLDWIGQHPSWANLITFCVACVESLAIIGFFVPGVALMFGMGAIVATSALDFWEVMGWAAAGAICGDGLSYWLGSYYQERLRGMWPFSRHPEWLDHGEAFFRRHGGKSVLFGRFVGPIRAVIPLIAGMLKMPPKHFFRINILSGLLWAPAYLIPGVVFGASLGLASQVATRLVVMFLVIVGLLWLVASSVRRIYLFLQPRAQSIISRILAWGRTHPVLGEITAAIFDPIHPEARGLFVLAVVLVLASWGFFSVLHGVLTKTPLVHMDSALWNLLQDLRTPLADHLMVLFTQLGDTVVLVTITLTVLSWLLWNRHWMAAGHWLAMMAFAFTVDALFKITLQIPRPIEDIEGLGSFSFPSGHATKSTLVYGFLAVMIARELPPDRRWLAYSAAGLLSVAIGFSRLYLGVHWLSDVLGGITLALAWVALLGIAYRRHPSPPLSPGKLTGVALGTLLLVAGWQITTQYASALERYAPRYTAHEMSSREWWQSGWQRVPAFRRDMEGQQRQPLSVQWAGAKEQLHKTLLANGWEEPIPFRGKNILFLFLPSPCIEELPVLPQVHDGRHESLLMIKPNPQTDKPLVIRLWPADVRLQESGQPLWVGYVSSLELRQPLRLLSVPSTSNQFSRPLQSLSNSLKGVRKKRVLRPGSGEYGDHIGWNGKVLLLQEKSE